MFNAALAVYNIYIDSPGWAALSGFACALCFVLFLQSVGIFQ